MTASATGNGAGVRSRAGRGAGIAALVLLGLLPVAMTVANRSAPAVVTIAAVLAVLAAAEERGLRRLMADGLSAVSGPVGFAGLALIAVAIVSLAWSAEPSVTLFALGEALLPAGAALALALSLPRQRPRWIVPLFAISVAVAAIDIVVELTTDQTVRRMLGLRPDAFIFNRSVVTLVVMVWPLTALLIGRGRHWALALGAAIVAAAVLRSHSGAATLGLVAGLAGLGIAAALPRVATGLAFVGLVAALVIAPVIGDVAHRVLPEGLYTALASSHPRDRVAIWQSFGAVVAVRPLGGTGFGTSRLLADHAVAGEVPAEHATLLGVGHPHSASVQLWTELGVAGALAGGAFLIAAWRALAHLKGLLFVTTYGFGVAALSIALVGHGAWQGWWIANLGASLVWFKLAADEAAERERVR